MKGIKRKKKRKKAGTIVCIVKKEASAKKRGALIKSDLCKFIFGCKCKMEFW